MPMEKPWQMVAQVIRSRPFLLCVILVLVGFLWIHYVTPTGSVGIVIAEVNVADDHQFGNQARNQSVRKGLYVDALPARNKSQDEEIEAEETLPPNEQKQSVQTEPYDIHQCVKKKFDVSFLKVHKAGSTTVMNIFLRFAIEHNLNIVLPRKSTGYGFNYLGYGETVSASKIVPLPANESYNILCNHVVYNKAAFHSIMPKDTVYVGILREPVSHFSSAATYYGFYKHLRESTEGKIAGEKVVSEFLKNPARFKIPTYFVYNRMSFDFGIPKSMFHDELYVGNYIDELDKDYELVLILEHFPESLVLMKRTLCWDTKDILYVPLNQMKSKPDFGLDNNDLENLIKWNSADHKLFNHFFSKFSAKVASLGEDFKEEVESFKSIQTSVKDFCYKTVDNFKDTTSVFTVPKTKWSESFTVTVRDCALMMEPELPMMKRLIDNAWLRYNASIRQAESRPNNENV